MSINQNANASALPNFHNLGILLRILVFVDGVCLAAALLKTTELQPLMEELLDVSSLVQPILMASLLVLPAANDWLHRLPYQRAITVLIALELAITTGVYFLGLQLFGGTGALARDLIFTFLITGILIGYFDLRGRALSPALTEARLQALQARIRPHFLFNSINAVLSLMRQEPRRAEQALEDLADLFRVLMADNRQLAPIAREVELAKQYLSIEELRLGDRLRIEWDVGHMPADALIPPLVLQPLLENAIYHGVEPGSGTGDVLVRVERRGDRVLAAIENPWHAAGAGSRAGNHMALDNIRERLMLFFDDEARLESRVHGARYLVEIEIPYRSGAA